MELKIEGHDEAFSEIKLDKAHTSEWYARTHKIYPHGTSELMLWLNTVQIGDCVGDYVISRKDRGFDQKGWVWV